MGARVSRAAGTTASKAASQVVSQTASQKAPRAASRAAPTTPLAMYEHQEQIARAFRPPHPPRQAKSLKATSTNDGISPTLSPKQPVVKPPQEPQSGGHSTSPEALVSSTTKPQETDSEEPKTSGEAPPDHKPPPSKETTASDETRIVDVASKDPRRSDRKVRPLTKKERRAAKRAAKRAEKVSKKAISRRASQRAATEATTNAEKGDDELDKLWERIAAQPDCGDQVGKDTEPNEALVVDDEKLDDELEEEESSKEDEDDVEVVEAVEEKSVLEEKKKLIVQRGNLGSRFIDIFYPFEAPDGRRGSLVAKRDEMVQVGPTALFPKRSVYVELTDSSSSLYPSPLSIGTRSYRSVHRYVLSPEVLLTDGTPSDQVCAILTDGSFSSDKLNPRQFIAGWAFDTGSEMISGPIIPPAGLPSHPSNSVLTELFAIWRALDWLHRSGEVWPVVVIVTDSASCVSMVTNPSVIKSHSSIVSVRGLLLLLSRMKAMNGLKKLFFWRVSRDLVKSCDVAADWERMRIQIHDKARNSQSGTHLASSLYP